MTTTFNFVEKSVRVEMDENNNPLFHAADVCGILGYANTSKAISDHCLAKGITKRYTPTEGGNQEMTFISEGNLYRLIIKSRKPEAEKFEIWVCDEVLPSIRKTGSYTNPNHQAPPAEQTPEKINREQLDQIERLVHEISICCHFQTSASWNVYAGIRENYGLKNGVQELPAVHFNTVYGLLNVLNEKARAYLNMRIAVDKQFCKDVLRKHQLRLDVTQQMSLPQLQA